MGERPLLAYYGDDFTGSTDVMEVLSLAGVRTLLFLKPLTPTDFDQLGAFDAVGVAGDSRTMTPGEMDKVLPDVFRQLKNLGPHVIHYKVCSTFDSSPGIGSIGHAIDVGQQILRSPIVPVVIGAPRLGRYCVFGHLFARAGLEGSVFRLDRHPTMRAHPITPMTESDLRLVLAEQTTRNIELMDILALAAPRPDVHSCVETFARSDDSGPAVLFDVIDEAQLLMIGDCIWKQALQHAPLFVAGSSGIEYALTAYWRASGRLSASPTWAPPSAAGRIVVLSGSCSPVTEAQTAFALAHGFAEVAAGPIELLDRSSAGNASCEIVRQTLSALRAGQSVVVHTCRGPQDPRLARTREWMEAAGRTNASAGRELGRALGRLLKQVMERSKVDRVVVAGGDTSAYAISELGVRAIEMAGPLAPGSPLCKVRDSDSSFDGLELVLKGGQTGQRDFLLRVRDGVTDA